MDLADPVAVALAVADGLDAEGVRHALYGGLLLAAYGEARETKDVDVAVVRADAAGVASLLDRRLGLRTLPAFDRQRFGGLFVSPITLVEGDELNTLDLVEPADPDYARRAVERAIGSRLRGRAIRVLTPEDFVVFKILSTRARDLDDAISVVRSLGAGLDVAQVEAEVRSLAASAPDHPITDRWRAIQGAAADPPRSS
jgi:hypothetical protein